MDTQAKIRWAVMGTGYIANRFAQGMAEVADAALVAVVSRDADRGRAFAERYGAEAVYTDLAEMLAAVKPDALYVATPNDCHYAAIVAALNAGVNVLSEKPMVDNRRQLDRVVALAKEKDLFLMEGMWTRCFPAVRQARAWLSEGRIGRPLTVRAFFEMHADLDNWQWWKAGLAHAGGALRDVGIYSIAMADMVFPMPPARALSTMHSNGEVDQSFRLLLDYGEGQVALVGGAFNQDSGWEVEIVGEKGSIHIGPEFWDPTTATLRTYDGTAERFEEPYPATGFQFEIRAVQDCLRRGLKQCPDYTWDDMTRVSDIIEAARKEWGIVYPADEA
ncbi:MAG: Gfo/Idh/MocA family oxidoreductase [Clostridia bacterium]|nr:Gfo/Idh/MocA family oxidoreductase [Clostridia bacterium]